MTFGILLKINRIAIYSLSFLCAVWLFKCLLAICWFRSFLFCYTIYFIYLFFPWVCLSFYWRARNEMSVNARLISLDLFRFLLITVNKYLFCLDASSQLYYNYVVLRNRFRRNECHCDYYLFTFVPISTELFFSHLFESFYFFWFLKK